LEAGVPTVGIALRRIITAVLFITTLAASPSVAVAKNCPYTPAADSAERNTIMDAVRKPVVKALGQRVVFVVAQLKVRGNWAFLEAEPQQPDGRPVDWTIGAYADAVANDMCGGYVHALLIKTDGRWRVREHVICATDVPYVTWGDEFGAPGVLFPRFD
jgi:hypothetical protein